MIGGPHQNMICKYIQINQSNIATYVYVIICLLKNKHPENTSDFIPPKKLMYIKQSRKVYQFIFT